MGLAAEQSSVAVPTTLIVVLIGSTLVSFGYLKAVMDRANKDYKTAKVGLPVLRKAFWTAFWGAVKVGFWVFVAALVLIGWMIHEVRAA